MFLVLWLGPPLERLLGSWRFGLFYLSAGLIAYTAYDLGVAAEFVPNWGPTAGASGCVLAMATLYALHFPQRTVDLYGIFRVPFWWLLVLFVMSDLTALFLGDGIPWVNNAVHLGGVVFGASYWLLRSASPMD
jgi:membrane associated rhomboid family serine protease